MRRTTVLLALVALFIWTGTALAGPERLKGTYIANGETGCMMSSVGFASDFSPLAGGPAWMSSSSDQAIRIFDGKGSGHVKATSFGMTHVGSQGPKPASSVAELEYDFTYTLDKDGAFTATVVPNTLTGRWISGPNAGKHFVETGFSVSGQLSPDGKTLVTAATGPEVIDGLIDGVTTYHKICHRARTWIRVGD